jgi:proteasome lid subunit RPN8/RPN11
VGRRVSFAVVTPNRARRQTEYLVDPETHIDLRRLLRKTAPRQSIIGAYHSHPSGAARPSPIDIARAHYPDWIHVIVAPDRRPAIRAHRIVGGRTEPVGIRWTG